jgi:hypothetical protein
MSISLIMSSAIRLLTSTSAVKLVLSALQKGINGT